jgi:hypothetical protein
MVTRGSKNCRVRQRRPRAGSGAGLRFGLGAVLLLGSLGGSWGAEVNLALMAQGGMPLALASAPEPAYAAAKAADDNRQTAWVSGLGERPVWWEVRWRFPVTVTKVVLQAPESYPAGSRAPQSWLLESKVDDQWQRVSEGQWEGDGEGGGETAVTFEPLTTMALRLVFEPRGEAAVAIGEVAVMGPAPVLPLAQAPAWQGRYIWVHPSLSIARREPVRAYLRRTFTIDDPTTVQQAWVVALAYDRLQGLWVNNQLILQDQSYHRGMMREAQVREVPRELLIAGENVICAEVHDLTEVGSQGLLAELILMDAAGQRTIIATDSQWRAQVDQGSVPQWRQPGFGDGNWPLCQVRQSPNGRWHWLWNVACPTLSPPDVLRLTALRVDPPRPRPGSEATVYLTFECDRSPARDYTVIVRLGESLLMANADHELWGAAVGPPAVQLSVIVVPLPIKVRTPITEPVIVHSSTMQPSAKMLLVRQQALILAGGNWRGWV